MRELIKKCQNNWYLEKRFKKYKSILDEYSSIIEKIKKLRRNDPCEDLMKSILNKIYNDVNNAACYVNN